MWEDIKYFKSYEFDSPDLKGSGELMKFSFLKKLDNARSLAKTPFKVSSGYRTKEHNKKIGGVVNSAHLHGYAADIVCTSDSKRISIINAAILSGIKRIGISDNFIHLDDDPTKSPAMWLYPCKFNIKALINNYTKPQDI